MSKIVREVNLLTGETTDREMTEEESLAYEEQQAKDVQLIAELEQKTAKKAALLDKLGITEDEAKLLLG